jgi:hypothetical protein
MHWVCLYCRDKPAAGHGKFFAENQVHQMKNGFPKSVYGFVAESLKNLLLKSFIKSKYKNSSSSRWRWKIA